jgi:hypothetical protein
MRFFYLVFGILVVELFLRSVGFGKLPLLVTDSKIEYYFKPSQDVRVFNNRVKINAYGMRANDFDREKIEGEFRVLIFGDSVINGGNRTDQKNLATELLREQLISYKNSVTLGNVSAGSWGPGNWLGYINKFGFFEADVVILVINTHDYCDNPSYMPLSPRTHPQQQPVSAISQLITYLLYYFYPSSDTKNKVISDCNSVDPGIAKEQSLGNLSEFLRSAQQVAKDVIVIQMLELSELQTGPREGFFYIKKIVEDLGIRSISTEEYIRNSNNAGIMIYRDNIHLTDYGQKILAKIILDAIKNNKFN